MHCTPQAEHIWLERFLGEWEYSFDMPKSKGIEIAKSLGGVWVTAEGHGKTEGSDHEDSMLFTLGYDPKLGRYVGTFVGSMIGMLWVYSKGYVDAETGSLVMEAEGPNFTGPGTTMFRDVFSFDGKDRRALTAFVQGADGEWSQMMRIEYKRKG